MLAVVMAAAGAGRRSLLPWEAWEVESPWSLCRYDVAPIGGQTAAVCASLHLRLAGCCVRFFPVLFLRSLFLLSFVIDLLFFLCRDDSPNRPAVSQRGNLPLHAGRARINNPHGQIMPRVRSPRTSKVPAKAQGHGENDQRAPDNNNNRRAAFRTWPQEELLGAGGVPVEREGVPITSLAAFSVPGAAEGPGAGLDRRRRPGRCRVVMVVAGWSDGGWAVAPCGYGYADHGCGGAAEGGGDGAPPPVDGGWAEREESGGETVGVSSLSSVNGDLATGDTGGFGPALYFTCQVCFLQFLPLSRAKVVLRIFFRGDQGLYGGREGGGQGGGAGWRCKSTELYSLAWIRTVRHVAGRGGVWSVRLGRKLAQGRWVDVGQPRPRRRGAKRSYV